jgi:hypothetical protein
MMDGSVIQGIPDEITIPADFEEWLFYDRMLWVRKAREHELDRLARAVAAQTDVLAVDGPEVAEGSFIRQIPRRDAELIRLAFIHVGLDGYFRRRHQGPQLGDESEVRKMQRCTAHLLAHGTVDEDLIPDLQAIRFCGGLRT